MKIVGSPRFIFQTLKYITVLVILNLLYTFIIQKQNNLSHYSKGRYMTGYLGILIQTAVTASSLSRLFLSYSPPKKNSLKLIQQCRNFIWNKRKNKAMITAQNYTKQEPKQINIFYSLVFDIA